MNCPICHGDLHKVKLAEHLAGQSCEHCKATSISLSDYLSFLERSEISHQELSENSEIDSMEADTKNAIVCDCGQIMHKYRINHNSDRRIDYCHLCQTIWLDKGEWEYLKSNNLHRSINKIFTDSYQRKIRLNKTQETLSENYQQKLGMTDYNRIKEIYQWVNSHKKRAILLAYLNSKNPYSVNE